ncbi:MAG: SPFH domain-containing protein [Acidobacteriota bacterium]|nr:SPFH domain-containing protein [Blastocatellia bacterium]MDW8412728.1 SPFH domain-containing protein [Acidobacteriota bacterium]
MTSFLVALGILIALTLFIQIISRMKIVGANELAVVAGKGSKGYITLRGGRVFIIPLINEFFIMDLRPQTTTVRVESAIAKGIVPLTVTATVSFTVASSPAGIQNAIRRILGMTEDWKELHQIANSIIEGHLRDAIATMTPEEVMTDKDVLVRNMIRVCKADLENIGLEITAMNIADVDDHRLPGVEEPELYIALLKRIQAANAEAQAREAEALSRAISTEASEQQRAEVAVCKLQNEKESLTAETRVKIAQERQRAAVGVQQVRKSADAQIAGIRSQIEAEKLKIEMLKAKYETEIILPAEAQRQKLELDTQAQAAAMRAQAEAELNQLRQTLMIISKGGQKAIQAYLIENLDKFTKPLASLLQLAPSNATTVVTGIGQTSYPPISAIHPHPIEQQKAQLLQTALGIQETPTVVKS